MANNYTAPYLINGTHVPVPATGTFTIPVCTTAERFDKIMNALWFYGQANQDFDFDHLVDFLDACSRLTVGCVDFNPMCRNLALTDERITWYPESPYLPDPEVPDGYPFHPFTVVDASILSTIIATYGLGYQVGDVFVDLTKLPVFTGWDDIVETYANMPRVRLGGITGRGTAKFHILNIIQGGRMLIVVDGVLDPLNLRTIELNRDTVSFPPETTVEFVVEVEIETDGAHTIDLVWYPTVDDALIPIFFGGGIRSVEVCGFGVSEVSDPCCPETNDLLSENNAYLSQIVTMLQSGFKLVPINAGLPPDSVADGCSPPLFDSDPDDSGDEIAKRIKALCYVVDYYIQNLAYRALLEAAVPLDTIASLFPAIATGGLSSLTGLNPVWDVTWNVFIFLQSIATTEVLSLAKCAMIEGLSAKLNTRKNFAESVSVPAEDVSGLEYVFWNLLVKTNQSEDAWKRFNQALHDAMELDLDEYECPCDISGGCDDMTVVNGNTAVWGSMIIEAVEGVPNLYHIVNNVTDSTGFGVYGASITTDEGCCFDLLAPPEGYTMQDQAQHRVWDCNGVEGTLNVGGGVPTTCITRFDWDRGTSGAIDTYFTIIPHTGEPCE